MTGYLKKRKGGWRTRARDTAVGSYPSKSVVVVVVQINKRKNKKRNCLFRSIYGRKKKQSKEKEIA